MNTLHDRVNDLCARLSIRQNNRAQSRGGITYYTTLDSELDAEIALFLRQVENTVADDRALLADGGGGREG